MRYLFLFTLSLFSLSLSAPDGFKDDQLLYSRVREAFSEKAEALERIYTQAGLDENCRIVLKAYKLDQRLEIWGAANSSDSLSLLKSYAVCALSGEEGPKSRQGDYQVPEGFYHIDRFNPTSSYHLSLGIDYPNNADRKRSDARNLGGDIFIHGECVTIGCLPMTNDKIKEIYALAVNARDAGQTRIPVHIYPADPRGDRWPTAQGEHFELWDNLKSIESRIRRKELAYTIQHDGNGGYRVTE